MDPMWLKSQHECSQYFRTLSFRGIHSLQGGNTGAMGISCLQRGISFPNANTRLRFPRFARGSRMTRNSGNGVSVLPKLLDVSDPKFEPAHSFSSFSNWLVPGRILLGRYPFIEPSRCHRREDGEEQLMMILKAGVDTFVCLQDEIPPQSDMRVSGVKGFLPYKATAELMAASLSGPPPAEIVEGLRNPSLNRFLPPKKGESPSLDTGVKVDFIHCPIFDLSVPNVDETSKLLEDLSERVLSGENLYIHCWGGRGRAGIVGSCLVAKLYNLTADEALQRTSIAFRTRGDAGNQSPETEEQVQFVKRYIQSNQ